MSSRLIPRVAAVASVVAFVATLFLYAPASDRRRQAGYDPRARIERSEQVLLDDPHVIGEGWWDLADAILRTDEPTETLGRWLAEAPPELVEGVCGEGLVTNRMGSISIRGYRRDEGAARAYWTRSAVALEAFLAEHPDRFDYFHWYTLGLSRRWLGDCEAALRAVRETEKAITSMGVELPDDRRVHQWAYIGEGYEACGEESEALRAYRRVFELLDAGAEVASSQAGGLGRWGELAEKLAGLGDRETALEARVRQYELLEARGAGRVGIDTWRDLGWTFHELGAPERARRAWEHLLEAIEGERAGREDVSAAMWFELACARSLVGETEGALEAWERAVEAGYDSPVGADERRALDAIRGHPRFAAAYERMLERLNAEVESPGDGDGEGDGDAG